MSYSDLPEFIPKQSVDYLCKEACCCDVYDEVHSDSSDESDKRLANWRKWLAKRKKIHQNLGDVLHRDAGDLVMNAYEDLRCTKEEKLVFDYTNIKIPDPQRGCPKFFEDPIALPDPCNRHKLTEYIAQTTKEEMCIIPDIEYTKVPNPIKTEKGVLPKHREGYWTWSTSEYRQQQFKKLAEKIQMIEPHKPDLSELMIQGTKLSKPPHVKPPNCEEVKPVYDVLDFSDILKEKPLFIINYTPIFKDQSEDVHAHLFYNYNIMTRKSKRKKVKLENNSDKALRFRFMVKKRKRIFEDIRPEPVFYEQAFFYDKNEQIILPGEIKFFSFLFKSDFPRVWYEDYELILKPDLFPKVKIILHLMACAEYEGLQSYCLTIKERVSNATRKQKIHKVLRNTTDMQPILFKYNKKEIFEAVNTTFDPYHHQVHFLYNKRVVDELEQFYEKIRLPTHHPVWNLNIYDLRAMTKEREIAEREAYKAQVTKEFYDELEQDKLADLKQCEPVTCVDKATSKSDSKVGKDKGKAKGKGKGKEEPSMVQLPTIIKKYTRQEKPRNYSEELEKILEQLEMSKVERKIIQEKYDNVYVIICAHFDRLCEEIEEMKERLNIPYQETYPELPAIKFETPRLELEEKRDMYRENLAKISFTPPKWQSRRPAFLEEIPLEDYIKRYKLYFNIPDDKEEGGKKKKGKGKGKDKKAKKDKKGKKDKGKKGKKGKQKDEGPKKETCDFLEPKLSAVVDKHKIDAQFDPVYDTRTHVLKDSENIDVEHNEELGEEEEEPNLLTESILQQYAYNLHLYMYTTLENIFISVFDYLDSTKVTLSPEEVKVMVDCEDCGLHYKHRDIKNVNYIDLKYVLSTDELTTPCFTKDAPKYKFNIPKVDEVKYITDPIDQEESLFSILRNYSSEPEDTKPLSYPKTTCKAIQQDSTMFAPTFNKLTATSDEIVDPNWSYYKDKADQVEEKLRLSTKLIPKKVQEGEYYEEEEEVAEEAVEEEEEKEQKPHSNKLPLVIEIPGFKPEFCSKDDQYYMTNDMDSSMSETENIINLE